MKAVEPSLLDQGAKLVVLDLEASALGLGSYPIEVGLAIMEGGTAPIRTWSTLVRPTADWEFRGVWSPAAQAVHGIPIHELRREGRPVDEVCMILNALLRPASRVVTDAPEYDRDWLARLFDGAGVEQRFYIGGIERLAIECLTKDELRQYEHLLRRSRAPHRAGPDAIRLASAFLEARLSYRPQVRDLEFTRG